MGKTTYKFDNNKIIEFKCQYLNSVAREKIRKFISDLIEDDEIKIMKIVLGNSIVTWVYCRTVQAVSRLRYMIESGNFQQLLVVIFAQLLKSSDVVKVEIKDCTEELRLAELYIIEAGRNVKTH